MPLLLACVEAVNKIFGGLFLLVAMMWRDAKQPAAPAPQRPDQRSLGYGDNQYPRKDFAYAALTNNSSSAEPSYPRRRENTQRPHYYQSQ